MDYHLVRRRRATEGAHATLVGPQWATVAALLFVVALSAVVHGVNPLGQPGIWWDEGTYIHRGIVAAHNGLLYPRPEDMESNVAYRGLRYYGHPFLGWSLLAALFVPLDYPGYLRGAPDSVATLAAYYLLPRLLPIALAVVATYPVIRVGERAFGRLRYGLAAGGLYAVTPLTRSLAYVQLDNFMTFWLLLALHWALIARERAALRPRLAYALLSGGAFGAAVLTKLPALVLLPLFPLVFWRDLAPGPGGGGGGPGSHRGWVLALATGLPWAAAGIGVTSTWFLYAAATGEMGRLVTGLRIFAERDEGGWSFTELLDRFFRGPDPFLFYLGLGGLAYALLRLRPLVAAWAALYLAYLLAIPARIQYYVLPLIVPFALLGGFLLGDLAVALPRALEGLLHGGGGRAGGPARLGGAVLLALALLLPLGQTASLAAQDGSGPRLQALEWIVDNAPPHAVVVVNRAFVFVLRERRPDLWVIHPVQTDALLLDQWRASGGPPPPSLTIAAADGHVAYTGGPGYGGGVDLPAGRYAIRATRLGAPAGALEVELDRDTALVFVDPGIRVVELYDRHAPPSGGTHRLSILDPAAMPIYWLDDGMFKLPRNLNARVSPAGRLAYFANAFARASVYRVAS